MNKPSTIERQEYMQKIVDATNACKLPAAFKADIMESILRKLRDVADKELQRDMENYRAEMQDNGEQCEQPFTGTVNVDGR